MSKKNIDISSIFVTADSDLTALKAFFLFCIYYIIHLISAIFAVIILSPLLTVIYASTPKEIFTTLLINTSYLFSDATLVLLLFLAVPHFVKISLKKNRNTDAAWIGGSHLSIVISALLGIIVYLIMHGISFLVDNSNSNSLSANRNNYTLSQMVICKNFGLNITIFLNISRFILASSAEELICRGIVFGGFTNNFGLFGGIAFSTLAFLLLHYPIQTTDAFITYMLISLIAVFLRITTKSIGAPIMFHFFYNLSLFSFFVFDLL